MSSVQSIDAQQICENMLLAEKRYNNEHHIWPSESAVADRLLVRGVEMKSVYEELHGKLHTHPPALQVFLGLVLSAAAFWSLEKIQKARAQRDDLENVNRKIGRIATDLATLLGQRDELHNTSGFSSDTHYHVGEVINAASQDNYLFQVHVRDKLDSLYGQFDLKCWLPLSRFVAELASDPITLS